MVQEVAVWRVGEDEDVHDADSAYGASCDIDFKFAGTVANTVDVHRVVQWVQETKGEDAAMKVVECE